LTDATPSREPRSRLLFGLFLLLLGTVLLAVNIGFELPREFWLYCPLLLIVPGLLGVLLPSRHLSRSSGISLLAAGLYCWVSLHHWFGLRWWTAWPIFLIGSGLSVMLRPAHRWPRRLREPRGPHRHIGDS
jgi:hypothetical protein